MPDERLRRQQTDVDTTARCLASTKEVVAIIGGFIAIAITVATFVIAVAV
jgi:hypothetical protein